MSHQPNHLRPSRIQEHHSRPVGGGGRGLAPLGAGHRGLAGRRHRADARRRPPRAPARAFSTSLQERVDRPSQRPAASAPTGHVLATDISPAHPRVRRRGRGQAGLGNVETLEADGEDLSAVGTATYDAAISRVGLIYFPDQQRALTEICRTLRPGGRLSSVVYSTADRNGFFSIPVGIIRRIAGLPAPAPGLPGPVQSWSTRCCGGGVRRGRSGRRHGHGDPVAGADGEREGVRPVREGVVRRPPPDARRRGRRTTCGSVGRDRGGSRPVRGTGRLRRAVRDARRLRNASLINHGDRPPRARQRTGQHMPCLTVNRRPRSASSGRTRHTTA